MPEQHSGLSLAGRVPEQCSAGRVPECPSPFWALDEKKNNSFLSSTQKGIATLSMRTEQPRRDSGGRCRGRCRRNAGLQWRMVQVRVSKRLSAEKHLAQSRVRTLDGLYASAESADVQQKDHLTVRLNGRYYPSPFPFDIPLPLPALLIFPFPRYPLWTHHMVRSLALLFPCSTFSLCDFPPSSPLYSLTQNSKTLKSITSHSSLSLFNQNLVQYVRQYSHLHPGPAQPQFGRLFSPTYSSLL